MTAKTPAAKTAHECICSHVVASFDETDRALQLLLGRGTRCMDSTRNEFAPGHDAKLKSFLITAGSLGVDVSLGDGQWMEATKLAGQFGFGHQVTRGIAARKAHAQYRTDRANAKSAKKAIKAAKPAKAPKALASNLVDAKVGRHFYRGYVGAGGFHYTDAKGNAQVAAKFTVQ